MLISHRRKSLQRCERYKKQSKRAQWHMPVIPALRRLRQEESSRPASLGYISKPCCKIFLKNERP
jgi:hypothetical protein